MTFRGDANLLQGPESAQKKTSNSVQLPDVFRRGEKFYFNISFIGKS